jgi:flagellar biosynthesis/type III secretory pathway protein FliH
MHDVFVKIANAYDLVNRPGVSVQAKKWIQDNVANIDVMTNLQLVNMMANLPLNVQTELKQIITNYKGTQGYKQNKPMGYQQPNQQAYQQGYQQGYQQQNMYQNQGGMVRPQ